MEFLTAFLQLIAGFFEGIFYYFFLLFFLSEPAYTHIFKIVLLLIIGFLIHTAFRPAKWKWVALYVGEALFAIGAVALGCVSSDFFFYSLISMAWAFILFIFIVACHVKSPAPAEETPEN